MLSRMLLIALVAAVMGAFLFYRVTSWVRRVRISRRMARGLKGELRAEKILRRAGYRVESVQPRIQGTVFVDGHCKKYELRPDGMAVRGRCRYVVEVKTGKVAVDPLFRDTRRQILEYYHFLPVDGVLLVDADAGTVQEVVFGEAFDEVGSGFGTWVVAFGLGVIATLGVVFGLAGVEG